MTTKRFVVAAVWVLVLSLAGAEAQILPLPPPVNPGPPPGVYHLTASPRDGTNLTFTSIFYHPGLPPVLPFIDVKATIRPVPPGLPADYSFYVNGVAMGPGVFTLNGWALSRPLTVPKEFSADAIQIPIVVEFVHLPSQTVMGRVHNVILDHRMGALQPRYGPQMIEAEAGAQLTARGIDALEPLHQHTMSNIGDLNARLTAAIADEHTEVLPDTEPLGSATNACVLLSDLPREFTSLDAYQDAQADANLSYATYLGAQAVKAGLQSASDFVNGLAFVAGGPIGLLISEAVSLTAEIAVNNYLRNECVRQLPSSSYFEVCVGRISTTMTDLDVASVDTVDLSLRGRSLGADVTLGDLNGTVDATLGNLLVRWKESPGNCSFYPSRPISSFAVQASPDVSDWATCRGLVVGAAGATTLNATNPSAISPAFVMASTSDSLVVNQTTNAAFALSASRSQNTSAGACGDPAIEQWVDDVLTPFYPLMTQALNDTWNEDAPSTSHAQALETLLSPLEIGLHEPNDLALYTPFYETRLNEETNPNANFIPGGGGVSEPHGLYVAWDSDPLQRFPGPQLPGGWVYPQPTWRDPVAPQPAGAQYWLSTTGLDVDLEPFHLSFAMSTGALNQFIRERYIAPRYEMARGWRPTYDDFGVQPPPGATGRTRVLTTGTWLGTHLHPAFASYGNAKIRIEFRPTNMPFLWIPPQPAPGTPPNEAPLVYHMYQFIVDFIQVTPVGADPIELRVAVDFLDKDFDLSLDADNSVLTPAFGAPEFGFQIVGSRVPNCPLAPRSAPGSCEASLTQQIAVFLRPHLERSLLGLLRGIPAPLTFDAGGGGITLRAEEVSRRTAYQMIVFYMNLVQ